jgi:pimeloyl-ACP methyl ester carboxylesterase
MKKHLTFPLFNLLIGAIFGAVIGYYSWRLLAGTLLGVLFGFLIGLVVEWLASRLGITHWLYRRRVLLTVLLEIPLAIFILGPYAIAYVELRPNQHAVCCQTPLDYGATEYEHVHIQTPDGVTLAGWYVPPRQAPGAVIVVLHGAHADRIGSLPHAQPLIEAGYGVLLYDQRALGESTGDTLSYGWLDGADLLAAVDYLASRPEVDPNRIGAVGLSGGGHVALNAAYLEQGRMAALWLDGVGAQGVQDFPDRNSFGEEFIVFLNRMVLKFAELQVGRPAPPPFVEILPALDETPIVLVAASLGGFEHLTNQKYASLGVDNVEVWIIDNTWHLGGITAVPEEYTRRMLEFFHTCLGQ